MFLQTMLVEMLLCNRGISATTGTCDLLDLTLDAPYYLDPDFFDANPLSRLMERWDGTTVPTESLLEIGGEIIVLRIDHQSL